MSTPPSDSRRLDLAPAVLIERLVNCALLIGLGPVIRVRVYLLSWWPRATLVAVVAVVAAALVVLLASLRLPRPFTLAVAAGAGAVASAAGTRVGLWVAAGVVLASWVLLDRAPLPGLRGARAATPAVVGLSLGAAFVVLDWDRPLGLALAFVAAAVLVTVVAALAPGLHGRLDRLTARFGLAAGWLVSRPLLALLWVVVSGLPWIANRILRFDPTAAPVAAGSCWVERRPTFDRPERMWSTEVASATFPGCHRLRSSAASLLVLAMLVPIALPVWGGIETLARSLDTAPESGAPKNAIWRKMITEPWWQDFDAGSRAMWEDAWLSQWVGVELPDLESPYLNIEDGRRRSWRPADGAGCAAPLRVWFMGGSTMFGVGQRDDHTVASEVARAAARDGVRMEADNWGVPGDVTWQENRRVERALLRGDEPPDLVVFFDGWNDLGTVTGGLGFGRDGKGDFLGPLDAVQMRAMKETLSEPGQQRFIIEFPTVNDPAAVSDTVKLQRAAEQYAAGHEQSGRLLDARDIPWVRYLQPNTGVKARVVPGESEPNEWTRTSAQDFRRRAPDSVVDLSEAFDDVDEPLYVDDVHTSERGNELLGPRIYRELTERFGSLFDRHRGEPCA